MTILIHIAELRVERSLLPQSGTAGIARGLEQTLTNAWSTSPPALAERHQATCRTQLPASPDGDGLGARIGAAVREAIES